MIKRFVLALLSSALVTSVAHAGGHCAAGKTLTDGKLTIATGNPAYYLSSPLYSSIDFWFL